MSKGLLIYVVGASGAGKDTLLKYARHHLDVHEQIVFAHRYITRPADAGGENHVALTHDEFQLRLKHELFALHWESHGNFYGIGNEIEEYLNKGFKVVVNGSRAYLPTAEKRFPGMLVLSVTVDQEILRQRLTQRGRESQEDIEKRIQRAEEFKNPDCQNLVEMSNNEPLSVSGPAFLDFLVNWN